MTTLIAVPVAPVLVQGDDERADQDGDAAENEGGLEGTIEGFVGAQGLLSAILVLVVGGVLLTVCVENLISYLTRAALKVKLSLFALAILFTGSSSTTRFSHSFCRPVTSRVPPSGPGWRLSA